MTSKTLTVIVILLTISGCGGGGSNNQTETEATASVAATNATNNVTPTVDPVVDNSVTPDPVVAVAEEPVVTQTETEIALQNIISRDNLVASHADIRNLPDISSAKAQLGKLLFYSTNLGGEQDSACVSCHHPALGGGDRLSLSIGVHAVDENNIVDAELLGPGRHPEMAGNLPLVGRNAPTVFNAGLTDRGMFWDSRVASVGNERNANGTGSSMVTPDSENFRQADTTLPVGTSLPAAQARFPVTAPAEMRAQFAGSDSNQSVRAQLAARFENPLSGWPDIFSDTFGDSVITFDRIAEAIGEFERSMVFVNSRWNQFVAGDVQILTDQEKEGALLFFTAVNQGGAGCSRCHSGNSFSDGRHHQIGFPQFSEDIGREAITSDADDRYTFRTPSLLNIAMTAPYGHAGLYATLEEVVAHYNNPRAAVDRLFGAQAGVAFVNPDPDFCQLDQISRIMSATGEACESLMPEAYDNSQLALNQLQVPDANGRLGPTANLNNTEIAEIVSFLETLTDPCLEDRACIDPWIIDADDLGNYPDDSALIAHDEQKLDY